MFIVFNLFFRFSLLNHFPAKFVQKFSEKEDECDDETSDDDPYNKKIENVWFDKVTPLVNHFRKVSKSMIFIIGTLLAIDEMIIRYVGRSSETHRIKNKPISEG